MCIQCLGHFSSLPPHSPLPLSTRQKLFCPCLYFCWRESISNNRKEQGFLLVEIRIAIQEVDSHCFIVHVCYLLGYSSRTNLFSSSWSPSPIGLSCFKVYALVSLRGGQQMLSSFLGVLPILIPPLCVLDLSCDQSPITLLCLSLI
jgi:hypothetical protein